MEQYIPKSALVAELNRLVTELVEEGENTMFEQGRISAFEDAKLFLDTLEVKEVDLDEEFDKCCKNYVFDDECEVYTARHFFKLGLSLSNKAQKEEEV